MADPEKEREAVKVLMLYNSSAFVNDWSEVLGQVGAGPGQSQTTVNKSSEETFEMLADLRVVGHHVKAFLEYPGTAMM